MRDEVRDLPHVVLLHEVTPGPHAGVANAVVDCRIGFFWSDVGALLQEFGSARIEAAAAPGARALGVAVAAGAIVGVKLLAGGVGVSIVGGNGVLEPRAAVLQR